MKSGKVKLVAILKMKSEKVKQSVGYIENLKWEGYTGVISNFFPPAQVEASPGTDNSWLITCKGIGFRNPVSIAP